MAAPQFPAVYLLHGTGGSPDGSVRLLQIEIVKLGVRQNFIRPRLPHSNPDVLPSESVPFLNDLAVPEGALLIGISLGGLVAAKLQESERDDLHVIAINSPTWAEDTELHVWKKHRASLYCSKDEVIAGRTGDWPLLAGDAHDLSWLDDHDTDPHKENLAYIIRFLPSHS